VQVTGKFFLRDVEGNSFQRHESTSSRSAAKVSICVSGATPFPAIIAKLSADEIAAHRSDRFQYLHFLVANASLSMRTGAPWQDCREFGRDDLITSRSCRLIVESPAPLHSEIFRHGDLHAFDVISIPEGSQTHWQTGKRYIVTGFLPR